MESPTSNWRKGKRIVLQIIFIYNGFVLPLLPVVCDAASVTMSVPESGRPDPRPGRAWHQPRQDLLPLYRGKYLLGRLAHSSAHGDEPWRTEGA